jgi:hypothetical protein
MERVSFIEVLPFKFRKSSVGRQTGSASSIWLRWIARKISWHLLLKRRLQACFQTTPDLVVLANDAAFPYNHICQLFHWRRIPFLLVQEGIRFSIPATLDTETYGQGGATAIAAWGETSRAYFRNQGVPDCKIHLTGTPRFDAIPKTDWQAEADLIKARWKLGEKTLLFLSNPIDDQGFCTTREKLELVQRFIMGIASLFEDPDFHLLIKLHTRESAEAFQALITDLPFAERIKIFRAEPLYPLFERSRAAIVLASTAGLEALLFGLPLGVLEIPRIRFVHDYVSSGAAQGLTWDVPLAEQVRTLLEVRPGGRESAAAYVADNLATRHNATARVVKLIADLTIPVRVEGSEELAEAEVRS